MTEPQRIGRFLAVDEFGHVIPDVAPERIGAVWQPLVTFVRDALVRRGGVRAIYLRGSIPRGLAIENVSDADFIYFSETDSGSADAELEQAVETTFPFVKGLELFRLDRAAFDKIRAFQTRPYYHMLLKTQCLFLAGDDLTKTIAPFRIGADMVSHAFSLASDFARLPGLLEQGRKAGLEQAMHQWFSRRIVRAAFEVTMDRSNRFTRDLYLCWEQFAECYPDRSKQTFRVLTNCLSGEENPLRYGELVAFLAREAERLAAPSHGLGLR